MNEKLQSALQSIDLTQIILAAAGGLGGMALWGRKRFRTVVEWRKRRTARRKAVRELPERVASIAEALAAMSERGQKMLEIDDVVVKEDVPAAKPASRAPRAPRAAKAAAAPVEELPTPDAEPEIDLNDE